MVDRKKFLTSVMHSAGLKSLKEADLVTRVVLGVLKREIGVQISKQVEEALTSDLRQGWKSVEVISSEDLRESIK
jgi:uncharacterized protein (DUF2267 family)